MSWASGIRVDGEFSIANGDVNQLMAVYTRDFNMTGSVNTTVPSYFKETAQ